jgi:hypothetical protein
LESDGLVVVGELIKHKGDIQFWDIYEIKYQENDTLKKVEISPYSYDEKRKIIKFLILGNVKERRRFVRYKVKHLGIKVYAPGYFVGILDDISVGGCKIDILEYQKLPEPYHELRIEVEIEGKRYPVEIFPINVTEKFINAMFLGDTIQSSIVFNQVMSILNPSEKTIRERRIFRRFHVEKIPLYVDLPFGYGKVLDISLKGAKIKLLKYDPEYVERTHDILLEFYFLGRLTRFLTRGKIKKVQGDTISVEFTKLTEKIVDLIKVITSLEERGAKIRTSSL